MTSPASNLNRPILSPDSFSLISSSVHSGDNSDSSESYSGFDLSDPSSDDEIVWSFSDSDEHSLVFIPRSQGTLSPGTFSDEDVVVLSRPRSAAERYQSLSAPTSGVEAITRTLAELDIARQKMKEIAVNAPTNPTDGTRRNLKKSKTAAAPASTSLPGPTQASPKALKRAKKKAKKAASATATGLVAKKPQQKTTTSTARPPPSFIYSQHTDDHSGEHPVVDDVSEAGDHSAYEEAVQYVNAVLANPAPKPNSNLTLLHALIIELGVFPAAKVPSLGTAVEVLPPSLRAAKALLKSTVFLNVRDYLAIRHKGLDALRGVMHPSRQALANDIRGSRKAGRRVPVDFVKKSGLGVFLVTCYR